MIRDSEKLESPISKPVAVPFGTTADNRKAHHKASTSRHNFQQSCRCQCHAADDLKHCSPNNLHGWDRCCSSSFGTAAEQIHVTWPLMDFQTGLAG